MPRFHIAVRLVVALVGLCGPLSSLGQSVAGGESGFDSSLEATVPENTSRNVGLGGSDPADIARYLLASNGGARGGRLSPDGEHLAFLWSITGEPQVWILPASGGFPSRLTYGNGISFFRWAPDSQSIIYGADNDGNEQEAYFSIAIETGAESVVLPAASGGFRRFGDFTSNGETIVYASTERNRLDFDIYSADVETGAARILYQGTYGFFVHSVSPDGQFAVVSETVGEDSDNLYLLTLASGEINSVSRPQRRSNHTDGGIAWKQDSSGFYLATNLEREFAALSLYDLEQGFSLVESFDHDVDNVTLCGANDRYMAWTVNEGGYSRLHVLDTVQDRKLSTPDLPEGVYGLDCQGEPAKLAITINGWRTPGNIVVWSLQDQVTEEVFAASLAGLDPEKLIRPRSITLPARDGVVLQGLLYLPDEASQLTDGAPPVVFFVHGGPTGQSRPNFDPIVQYHVDRGLAVFEPNVRGSTGFGHTYTTLDDRENRLESIEDLVDMLRHLNSEGLVNGARAAVVGGSYGGYAVNSVLANFPGYFVAGAALFGVSDWVTALQVASPALKASDRIEYGDITEQRWIDYYTENSPIRQADQIDVPVLYSHGVMDPRIDIAETEVMVKTLRANGVGAPYIRIPDEGHGWRKLENQLFYYPRQAEFLEQQLLFGEEQN
jgi:dipeptidyl aminopeptidase/acylaminoacyl peptidase